MTVRVRDELTLLMCKLNTLPFAVVIGILNGTIIAQSNCTYTMKKRPYKCVHVLKLWQENQHGVQCMLNGMCDTFVLGDISELMIFVMLKQI